MEDSSPCSTGRNAANTAVGRRANSADLMVMLEKLTRTEIEEEEIK